MNYCGSEYNGNSGIVLSKVSIAVMKIVRYLHRHILLARCSTKHVAIKNSFC